MCLVAHIHQQVHMVGYRNSLLLQPTVVSLKNNVCHGISLTILLLHTVSKEKLVHAFQLYDFNYRQQDPDHPDMILLLHYIQPTRVRPPYCSNL